MSMRVDVDIDGPTVFPIEYKLWEAVAVETCIELSLFIPLSTQPTQRVWMIGDSEDEFLFLASNRYASIQE